MIRRAEVSDAARIEAFLAGYPETSMFLRGNLETHGIGQSDHEHACDYFLWPAEGPLRAVFGCSNNGFLMLQCPGREAEAFSAAAGALAGRQVQGLTGDAAQARLWLKALGLSGRLKVDHVEPLYDLELAAMPRADLVWRQPEAGDAALLAAWFLGYEAETGTGAAGMPQAAEVARDRARRIIEAGISQLLLEAGRPVGMAAVNARVKDIVQVGGVYVPPEARNRGVGRRAVQALLMQVAADGASRAVLFSNNDAASRAYEAIGFRRVGDYRVALTDGVVALGGVPA
ncbi:GNAT family N-acetyltransferase [Pseudodonghicola xiamenensis]|uniref:N-acetyltransferase n=1 Tax=Pseudodonghicola xiamenensis TaxID=337702 RepID=A0A8J3H687_9RHOB|nr:GNAT family N-acetyltransferase [Pseudodonghicola xiamenensis]GHG84608.1 N-acetyltransferase [Pseudodonghicola xiamenensis]